MKSYAPHIVVLGGAALIVLLAIVTNSAVIGYLVGVTAAMMVDPIRAAVAVLLGIVCRRHASLLIGLIGSAIAISLAVGYMNHDMGARLDGLAFAMSIVAALLWGYAANALALALRRRRTTAQESR